MSHTESHTPARVKKTFRLSAETVSELAKLAERDGISQTEALERAIRSYGTEPYESHTVPDAGADAGGAVSEAVASLSKQLEVKDSQIESLSRALESAQHAVEQAHILHAADKREPVTIEARSGGRWRRFIDWLRG